MNIQSNLEINFHQQDEVSVFLENTARNREEKFGEILLFCSFTLRNLINFRKNDPIILPLALLLSKVKGNLRFLMNYKGPDEPNIIDYPRSQGRKRFVVKLRCSDEYFNFQCNHKGFGLFSTGIGYYAPNSVITLMKYLAKKRQDDTEYIEALENAAEQCGGVYLNNKLSMLNQNQTARKIAGESYEYGSEK